MRAAAKNVMVIRSFLCFATIMHNEMSFNGPFNSTQVHQRGVPYGHQKGEGSPRIPLVCDESGILIRTNYFGDIQII